MTEENGGQILEEEGESDQKEDPPKTADDYSMLAMVLRGLVGQASEQIVI